MEFRGDTGLGDVGAEIADEGAPQGCCGDLHGNLCGPVACDQFHFVCGNVGLVGFGDGEAFEFDGGLGFVVDGGALEEDGGDCVEEPSAT